MKKATLALLIYMLAVCVPSAGAAGLLRQKPGPQTIRGIALSVSAHAFTLVTTHHGSFQVSEQGATRIERKGKPGAATVHEGDHISVRGFVSRRQIRAILIRIYPVKPAERSVRGTVVSVKGSTLTLMSSGKRVTVRLSASTVIVTSAGAGTVKALSQGASVLMRIAETTPPTALHIHVYQQRVSGTPVEIRGTIAQVHGSSFAVNAGKQRWTIAVNGATSIREGSEVAAPAVLKAGQRVLVHACCAGHTLTATSIHIYQSARHPTLVAIRGRLVTVAANQLVVQTNKGRVSIATSGATRYEIGSKSAARGALLVGDDLDVRAAEKGQKLTATIVHVVAASRRPRAFGGIVLDERGNRVTVRDRAGKTQVLTIGRGSKLVLHGKAVAVSGIRRGDGIRGRAARSNSGLVTVGELRVSRKEAKPVSARGVVLEVQGSVVVLRDSAGKRWRVDLGHTVHPHLHGQNAPADALFAGVHARARGYPSGGTLRATALDLSVRTGHATGRIQGIHGPSLSLRTSRRTERIDLSPAAVVSDGRHRITPGSLHSGAYVRAAGYVEGTTALRANSILIEHPKVDSAAVIVATATAVVVRTSAGQRYQLRVPPGAPITVSRTALALSISDLASGMHVHVTGTVDAAGRLTVGSMTVHLESVTVRGTLTGEPPKTWQVHTTTDDFTLRPASGMDISQGSHTLLASDLVRGDEVSAYGYRLPRNTVLTRKLLVHRKRVRLAGTVAEVTSSGFTLHATDGDHSVVTSEATIFAGTQVAVTVGLSVHVSGYLRGDGVILATKVTVEKTKSRSP